jgi:hypothetical protein
VQLGGALNDAFFHLNVPHEFCHLLHKPLQGINGAAGG